MRRFLSTTDLASVLIDRLKASRATTDDILTVFGVVYELYIIFLSLCLPKIYSFLNLVLLAPGAGGFLLFLL